MKPEVKAAIALLDAEGFAVTKQIGQQAIQLVRRRRLDDETFWKYHVNKYEKRYSQEEGEEVETVLLKLKDLKWKRE